MSMLAIKGHAIRGREIIEILEMLGGIKEKNFGGSELCCWYYINENGKIDYHHYSLFNDTKAFTLEEFLEKFPYKVGDKVKNARINDCIGRITNVRWDGNENQIIYVVEWDDMIKRMLPYFARDLQPYKEKAIEEIKIDIPKGYEFAGVDNDKQQVVFTKIQFEYPKTYDECCKVLNTHVSNVTRPIGWKENLISKFQELIICRDAYWKIAGEQMGLGKPWEPNWRNQDEDKYCIEYSYGKINPTVMTNIYNYILAFPTEEIRDVFFENFKELIEQCKELL